jgi:hypothetical protein
MYRLSFGSFVGFRECDDHLPGSADNPVVERIQAGQNGFLCGRGLIPSLMRD